MDEGYIYKEIEMLGNFGKFSIHKWFSSSM